MRLTIGGIPESHHPERHDIARDPEQLFQSLQAVEAKEAGAESLIDGGE